MENQTILKIQCVGFQGIFHTERWKWLVYWATNLGCSYRSSQETPLGFLIYHRQGKIDVEFPCVSSIADFTWRNVDIPSLKMWYPRSFMDNYDEPGHVGIPYFQTTRTMVIFSQQSMDWLKRNCAGRIRKACLVGGIPTPLNNMSSSVGMILPNIWKVIKFMFQTTNQNNTCGLPAKATFESRF